MNRIAIAALASHWARNPLQLATMALALALATGLWSAVQAINAQARLSYEAAAFQLTGGDLERITHAARPLRVEDFAALRRAGWKVAPVLEGRTAIEREIVTVIGIDPLNPPPLPVLDTLPAIGPPGGPADRNHSRSLRAALADPGAGPDFAIANPRLADRLANGADGLRPVAADELPPRTVIVDIGLAEDLLGRPGEIGHLVALPRQVPGLPPPESVVPGLRLGIAGDASADDVSRLADSFHLNLAAFGFLAFGAGLFIVNGAAGLAFEQRRPAFRALRALGLPLRRLEALLLGETVAIALVSGAAGLVLGKIAATALLPDVSATLRGLYGAQVADGIELRLSWILSGLGLAALGAVLASAQAFWRLRALPLLAAPGAQAWLARMRRVDRWRLVAGVGLVLAGGAVPLAFDGLIAGFALLALTLGGATVLLPAALGVLLAAGSARARGPIREWFWADMRAQRPALSLALSALMLALATNVGVGTMVSSFRATFEGWLDQRLAAELYVDAADDTESEAISRWLLDRPEVTAALPAKIVEIDGLAGAGGRVLGIVDHPTYRDNWPLIASAPDVWDRVARGDAAIVNEQLARRADLWPGARVSIARDVSPGAVSRSLPVAGVFSDYGNARGQAIVSLAALESWFPRATRQGLAVRVAPESAASVADGLREALGLAPDAVEEQAAIKAEALRVFETTFVVTGALNALTLGVAAIGLLLSLLALRSIRVPQLAPVWALGVTRARLSALEVARSVALAGLTAILALPLGLAMAWALLAIVNVEAFGWRLPMRLFPLDWLRLGALALLAGAAAAALPAIQLRRTPPAALLRTFADER